MELNEPNLFEEHLDVTGAIIVNDVRDLLDGDLLLSSLSTVVLTEMGDDGVNEFSEVLSDWQVNKNILEETNEVLTGEGTDTLEPLELSEWVHGCPCDGWVLIVLHTRDEGDNVLNLVAVHHLLQEDAEWLGGLTHHVLHLVSQLSEHVLLQNVDVDWSTLIGDDVFAVVSLIEDELKLL